MNAYRLLPSVQQICKEEIKDVANKSNCNVFVKAVCEKLCILLPSHSSSLAAAKNKGSADDLLEGSIDYSLALSDAFSYQGRGHVGEVHGVALAQAGKLVICGLTSGELSSEPSRRKDKTVELHGHIAILTGGIASRNWPMAYWGKYGNPGKAGCPESLSKCFRPGDRQNIVYYAYS